MADELNPQDIQTPDSSAMAQPNSVPAGPSPIAKPPLAPPSNKPGMPALISMLGQMIHPTGQVQAGQAPQRPSRWDAFENFLGNFITSFAEGMGAAGSGPGANARGFGAAVMAPYNQNVQNYQMARQAQQDEAQRNLQQAEAARAQSQATMVTLPSGVQVPAAIYERLLANQSNIQSRENIAGLQSNTQKVVAGINATSREKVAAQNLAEKVSEFKSTDAYRKWKTNFDNETKIKVAQMIASKAPAAMLQTASFAQGALQQMSDAEEAMQRLETKGVFSGVGKNKVEDWIFGKGLVDPSLDAQTRKDIGKLRAALGNTSSATMRAHTGRTSQEIYNDFKNRLGAGQDWQALRGAMEETGDLLQHYVDAASNQSIESLRGGSAPASGNRRVVDMTKDMTK